MKRRLWKIYCEEDRCPGMWQRWFVNQCVPHPNKKVRERDFRDRSRLDVLLEDREGAPVIVECKQRQPTVDNVRQLRRYLRRFRREEKQDAHGILVHGGARKLRDEVRRAARKKPALELVQFNVGVDFSRSG